MAGLTRKMLRDMWGARIQFLSVLVMCLLGMMIYGGIEGVWHGMAQQRDAYFRRSNAADFWVGGSGFDRGDLKRARKLSGVTGAQLSTVAGAFLDSGGDRSIRLIANTENAISKPQVTDGDPYDANESGIWLDAAYARAAHRGVGERIGLYYRGRRETVTIRGLVLCPEYISYTGDSSSALPDHLRSSFGFVSATTLGTLCGASEPNQIKLTLASGTDTSRLKASLQGVLGARYRSGNDRTEWSGTADFLNKITQTQRMSVLYASVFFLLAVLTIQTTMKRLVRQQRLQIGILKGLGFYNAQIELHYACYGGIASAIGVAAGLCLAPAIVTAPVLALQERVYSMPVWAGEMTVFSLVLAAAWVGLAMLTALAACLHIVREVPAASLRDERPRRGRRLVIEHAAAWDRLGFAWRWSVRELAQNKPRSAMAIIAVAGSMVLLIASFGLGDSVRAADRDIYGKTFSYTDKISVSGTDVDTRQRIETLLPAAFQWGQEGSTELKAVAATTEKPLFVLDAGIYVNLADSRGEPIELPGRGVVLTQGVAERLHLKVGETVLVNVGSKMVPMRVAVIADVNLQGVYLSRAAWERAGGFFEPNTLYAGDSPHLARVERMDVVTGVHTLRDQLRGADELIESINAIMMLLLAGAVLLSVVILLNLGMLSFAEREREYATLRVLGFFKREVRSLVHTDTAIDVIVASIIGVPAGLVFLELYVRAVSTSAIRWHAHLSALSLLSAVAIVIGCSVAVCLTIDHRVSRIDMVDSLKSME